MTRKYKTSLAILAAAMLVNGVATAGDWSGILSATVGNDDNVTLGTDSNILSSNEKDNFLDVLATAGRYLTGNKEDGIRFSSTLYNREYDTEDSFNFFLVGGGLAYHKKIGDWYGRFGAKYNYLEFGGDPYETVLSATAEGRRKLNKSTELRLRYRYSDINSESRRFNNLDGDRHQARMEVRFKQGSNRYRLYYEFQTNDRADRSTATTFTSSSPLRHTLRANAKIPLNAKWGTDFDLRYRDSRYKDDNVASGVSTRRDDERFRAKAELNYKLNKKADVYVDYTYTDNDSNIDVFDYQRNVVSLGVNYLY